MSTYPYREQDLTKPQPTNGGILAMSFALATIITLLAWLGIDVALDQWGI
jgi:hypothetical protein